MTRRQLLQGSLVVSLVGGLVASWWMGGQLVAPVQNSVPHPTEIDAESLVLR
jgi:hypothetical protein